MYKTIIIGHLFYFFSQTNRDAKGKIWSSRSSQNLYHHVSRGGSQWEKISLGRIRNLGWVKSETFNLGYVAQTVKRLPTMQETRVQSLGREDLLEKEMAPHSSILVWKIPWTEEPGRLQSMGSRRVGHDWAAELNWTDSCFTMLYKFLLYSKVKSVIHIHVFPLFWISFPFRSP